MYSNMTGLFDRFYAWAGKRSEGPEEMDGYYGGDEDEQDLRAVKRKFYAWAGKRSQHDDQEEEEEAKRKFYAFHHQQPMAEKRKFYAWSGRK